MAWPTEADVAAQLGSIDPADPRLVDPTAASIAWCSRQRPDLDAVIPDDVRLAAIIYAAYLFRLRSAPQGLPSDDDLGSYESADLMATVYKLLGRKPKAR